MAKRHKPSAFKAQNKALDSACRGLDQLAEFEEFKKELLPALQKDVMGGLDPEEMAKKWQAYAMARLISIILAEKDAGKAFTACKDLLDRVLGKSIERKELVHRLGQLSEKELDSLLLSKLGEEDSSQDNG